MKQAKYIFAGSAILFLLTGVYFRLENIRSSSIVAGKYGGYSTRSIDTSGMYILSGIMFTLLLMFLWIEKTEKKQKDRQIAEKEQTQKEKFKHL